MYTQFREIKKKKHVGNCSWRGVRISAFMPLASERTTPILKIWSSTLFIAQIYFVLVSFSQ